MAKKDETPEETSEETTDESVAAAPDEAADETAKEPADEAIDKPADSAEETTEGSEESSDDSAKEEVVEEEVNEFSAPPVIDFPALLKPISEDSPGGESVRYSGVYDEINEARRADDTLDQGDWQVERKRANFKKVIELALPVLEKESKDMQISAWLAEALVNEYGFAGLRDSLKLLSGLQRKFWDTMFPEIDEGDMEGRANALEWMDQKTSFALKRAEITQGDGLSYFGWEDSKVFVIPDDIESLTVEEREKVAALKIKVDEENRTTADDWEKAVSQSRRAFYEELDVAIQECLDAFGDLNKTIEESFDPNQMPGLRQIPQTLDLIRTQTNKLLAQKRIEEPDPVEEEEDMIDGDGQSRSGVGSAGGSGAIKSRKDALRRLAQLSTFFRRTEPHSPVSYLVSRAVKWGNMPLESWLQDVIKDDSILNELRQTLGFNTEDSELGGLEMEPPAEPVIEE